MESYHDKAQSIAVLSALPTPGMLRWFGFWIAPEEMMKHMEQGQYMLLIAAPLCLPNIVNYHVPNFFAAVLLRQQVLSEGCCSDFGKVFMLRNGEHFLFGQAT